MIAPVELALIGLAQICWFIYLLDILKARLSPLGRIAKPASILALALLGLVTQAPWLLVAALLFSSIGDFALTFEGQKAFLRGLIAFAIAHLFYLAMFSRFVEIPALVELHSYTRPEILALLVAMVAAVSLIYPKAGSLKGPVSVYMLIIFVMAVFGLQIPFPFRLAALGVALFVISDFILGLREFRDIQSARTDKFMSIGVWVFYWFGQFLILAGFIYP